MKVEWPEYVHSVAGISPQDIVANRQRRLATLTMKNRSSSRMGREEQNLKRGWGRSWKAVASQWPKTYISSVTVEGLVGRCSKNAKNTANSFVAKGCLAVGRAWNTNAHTGRIEPMTCLGIIGFQAGTHFINQPASKSILSVMRATWRRTLPKSNFRII